MPNLKTPMPEPLLVMLSTADVVVSQDKLGAAIQAYADARCEEARAVERERCAQVCLRMGTGGPFFAAAIRNGA